MRCVGVGAASVARASPLLRSRGVVDVSNDVTPFGIVTDELLPWVSRRQAYSFLSANDNYSLGVWSRYPFLDVSGPASLDSSELVLLGLVRSLLDVSVDCCPAKPSQSANWGAETCAKRKSTSPCMLAISAFDHIAALYNIHLKSNRGIC